jgi:hypothetical protein
VDEGASRGHDGGEPRVAAGVGGGDAARHLRDGGVRVPAHGEGQRPELVRQAAPARQGQTLGGRQRPGRAASAATVSHRASSRAVSASIASVSLAK